MAQSRPRSIRLKRDGVVALVGGVCLFAVGHASGNNLLYLVAAPLWAMLLLALPLGWWNLRGLEVRRSVPAELYAGREARGVLLVRNGRRRLRARALMLVDEGTATHAEAPLVGAGAIASVAAWWRFGERGRMSLTGVRASSQWPFGFAEHCVWFPLPAELVVYPRPLPASATATVRSGIGAEEETYGHGTDDFVGLRPYRVGDSPRTVHWPTTARTGNLYVVERAGQTEMSVEIDVKPARGALWERALSLACGEVHRAQKMGRKVGLSLPAVGDQPARTFPPTAGTPWRRTLLEALACLPRVS